MARLVFRAMAVRLSTLRCPIRQRLHLTRREISSLPTKATTLCARWTPREPSRLLWATAGSGFWGVGGGGRLLFFGSPGPPALFLLGNSSIPDRATTGSSRAGTPGD